MQQTNQNLKEKHAADAKDAKGRKTRGRKSWLVIVLHLIWWKKGTFSLSCVAYRIVDAELITFQHSNKNHFTTGLKIDARNLENCKLFW